MSEGKRGPTEDEIEQAINKKHDLDDAKFVAWVKKVIRSKSIRINKYLIADISDGKMLKVEVEKFIKGISQGTRTVKGYLSIEVNDELIGLLDKIPKKQYQDSRTKEFFERPEKVIVGYKDLKKLDLDNLFE